MIRIKLIKLIVEKELSGNKFNEIMEFETLRRFNSWIKFKKLK